MGFSDFDSAALALGGDWDEPRLGGRALKGVEGGKNKITAAPRSRKCCENGHTCMGESKPLHPKTRQDKRDGWGKLPIVASER